MCLYRALQSFHPAEPARRCAFGFLHASYSGCLSPPLLPRMLMTTWSDYQDQAANLFRRMGHSATTNCQVRGARATHRVDVWVEFEAYGIPFRWAVECKHWNRKVGKANIEAFKSIVNDIGADRGFLMTENGFQTGALNAASNTNIMLISTATLCDAARADVLRNALHRLRVRSIELRARLRKQLVTTPTLHGWKVRGRGSVDCFDCTEQLGRITFVESAIDEALLGKSRFVLPTRSDSKRFKHLSTAQFLREASATLNSIERWVVGAERS